MIKLNLELGTVLDLIKHHLLAGVHILGKDRVLQREPIGVIDPTIPIHLTGQQDILHIHTQPGDTRPRDRQRPPVIRSLQCPIVGTDLQTGQQGQRRISLSVVDLPVEPGHQ